MSNEKIRHWIYMAIGFLILFSCGWYLLMHPSQVTKESLLDAYNAQQQAFENVASYLASKDISTDITDMPSVDNHFGVPKEDSAAYENYNSGMVTLMQHDVREVIVNGSIVRFVLKKHGGFLVREYGVIASGDAPISLNGSPRDDLAEGWYFYIMKED